jgi:hypothetical protein
MGALSTTCLRVLGTHECIEIMMLASSTSHRGPQHDFGALEAGSSAVGDLPRGESGRGEGSNGRGSDGAKGKKSEVLMGLEGGVSVAWSVADKASRSGWSSGNSSVPGKSQFAKRGGY